jgi:hypothetical protein
MEPSTEKTWSANQPCANGQTVQLATLIDGANPAAGTVIGWSANCQIATTALKMKEA